MYPYSKSLNDLYQTTLLDSMSRDSQKESQFIDPLVQKQADKMIRNKEIGKDNNRCMEDEDEEN